MKMLSRTFQTLLVGFLLLGVVSCIDDLDFDQVNDIVLSPDVDVDLVFFTLRAEDFEGANENPEMAVVRDTTRLDFLDDDYVQNNLKEVELTFKVENTFTQTLIHRFQFINTNGAVLYDLLFEVLPSENGTAVPTNIIENLTEVEVDAVRNSIRVVSEVLIEIDGSPILGELNLQSKALYSLEFSDL